MGARGDFVAGVRDALPVVPGFVPFGMIAGAAVVSVGIPAPQAIVMNLVVYAGTVELAAVELIRSQASEFVIVFTGLLISLRFMMLSAAIAPYFRDLPGRWRPPLGYILSTAGYVIAVAKFERDPATNRRWYFLGTAGTMWALWQVSFVVGVFVGPLIPANWQLEFTFPLVFLAMLFPMVTDRGTAIAAAVAGVAAVAAAGLPFNLGLIVAVAIGVGVGLLVNRWWS